MEIKKIDRKMLIIALKIAIGTSAAMFIAQALHLQNAGSAGTIALLTIVTTKWETVRLTIARMVTFAIAVLLVLFIFYGNKFATDTSWYQTGKSLAYEFLALAVMIMLGATILKIVFATAYNRLLKKKNKYKLIPITGTT